MVSKYFNGLIKGLGTLAVLDFSPVPQGVSGVMNDALFQPINMVDSQFRVFGVINRVTSVEAEGAMACTTFGVAVRVAERMTGVDMTKVAQLPHIFDLKNEPITQRGCKILFRSLCCEQHVWPK